MTDLRQAAQQALEALDKLSKLGNGNQDGNSLGNTIAQEAREHLFTALAQPEQQAEPKCEHCHGIGKTLVYGIEKSWEENCLYCNGTGITPATQPEQEPVAFYHPHKGFHWAKPTHISAPTVVNVPPMPLYTAPPATQRPWVGLTDEDMKDLKTHILDFIYGARWAEAKLKERNNG